MDKVNNAGVFEGLTNTNNKPILANHVLLNEYLPGESKLLTMFLPFERRMWIENVN